MATSRDQIPIARQPGLSPEELFREGFRTKFASLAEALSVDESVLNGLISADIIKSSQREQLVSGISVLCLSGYSVHAK